MKKSLIALAIGGFGIGLTEFVIMGILPDVAKDLSISIPKAGHFISAYALGVVIGAPLFTSFGSKWPAHRTLFVLMIWFTVFNTLSAFAGSYPILMLCRFLAALPHGAFFGIGAVVAGQLAKPGKSAAAIATMFTGLTVANVLGVPLGTYLGHHFKWNFSFYLIGIVGLIALLSIYFWMPKLPQSSSKGLLKDLGVLKRKEVIVMILLTTIGTGGFFAWYSYIAPLVTEVAGISENYVSYLMILAGLGMFTGNLIGAKLAERFSPINAVLITLAAIVIVLILNSYLAQFEIGVIFMTFTIGTAAFCLSTPIQMAIINSAKGSEMLGSSLNQSAFNMGNASGAYLAGLPIAYGLPYTSASLVGAVLASTGVILAIWVIRIRNSKKTLQASETTIG